MANRLDRYQRDFDEGEMIFYEGDVGDSVFLIETGKVEIIKSSGGMDRVLSTLSNGEVAGEMALKDDYKQRNTGVKAVTDVSGWKLPAEMFHSLIDKNEEFRDKLVSSLLERLKQTTENLTDALESDKTLVELSLILLPLINPNSWENDEAVKTFEFDHPMEFLAYRFGASLDVIENLVSLTEVDKTIESIDPEEREKLVALAERIVNQGLDQVSSRYEFDREPDPELVDCTRRAKNYLEDLEDDEEIIDRKDLQEMMEDRKNLQEVLKRHQDNDRDDFMVGLLEMYLNSISREINQRYQEEVET